ncbi:MAG: metallophosphoesterase [Oligoflexales bacterium]
MTHVAKLESVWPTDVSLAVISDIHLKDMDDNRGSLLLKTIEQLTSLPLNTFVLLGDIFDFTLGSNAYYKRKFKGLGVALSKLAASGKKVIFFEGNHEFELAKYKWDGVQFVSSGDLKVDFGGGDSIILTHGDMLYNSWVYRTFRYVVKSKPVTGVATFTPGRFLDRLTLKSSELSRAQDVNRTMDHENLLLSANRWVDESDCTHGIFGHFHVPYAESRTGGSGKVVSMDCWDKPNLLLFSNGDFYRIFLEEELNLKRTHSYFQNG